MKIKHGALSHTVLMYASFMRASKKFTASEAHQFWPHKFRKSSDVARSCGSLVRGGYLMPVEDGWRITESGRLILARVANTNNRKESV